MATGAHRKAKTRSKPEKAPSQVPSAGRARRREAALPEQLSRFHGLGLAALSRASGIPEEVLVGWPRKATAARRERLLRIQGILDGLARVMRKDFIATWLQRPNQAAKGCSPLRLLEQGNYAAVQEMVYRFEAGEPF